MAKRTESDVYCMACERYLAWGELAVDPDGPEDVLCCPHCGSEDMTVLLEEDKRPVRGDKLEAAFRDAVRRTAVYLGEDPEKRHWKDPIAFALREGEDESLLSEAIIHYTATVPEIIRGPGRVRVMVADGYRAGPAGDH